MENNVTMTVAEISEFVNIEVHVLHDIIRQMVRTNQIVKIGRKRGTRYKLISESN